MAKDLRVISSFPRSEIEPGEDGIVEAGTVLLDDAYGLDPETIEKLERAGWVREATVDEITAELARTGEIDASDVEREPANAGSGTGDKATTSEKSEQPAEPATAATGRADS